jgi:DNA-binding PadR family transcriptional regulator
MQNRKFDGWICRLNNKKILYSFSLPKTPTQVKNEFNIQKFSLKPYLKRGLLKCLNIDGKKGRLYVLTNRARNIFKIPMPTERKQIDYDLIGWILASPKQRYVVLKRLSLNSSKCSSEEIRSKSSHLNLCLTRISTKAILRELIDKELVETEMGRNNRRYYWINEDGKALAGDIQSIICFSKQSTMPAP